MITDHHGSRCGEDGLEGVVLRLWPYILENFPLANDVMLHIQNHLPR